MINDPPGDRSTCVYCVRLYVRGQRCVYCLLYRYLIVCVLWFCLTLVWSSCFILEVPPFLLWSHLCNVALPPGSLMVSCSSRLGSRCFLCLCFCGFWTFPVLFLCLRLRGHISCVDPRVLHSASLNPQPPPLFLSFTPSSFSVKHFGPYFCLATKLCSRK